jgi:hypothetical protein
MDSNQVPGVCASSNTTMQQIGWQFVMLRNDILLQNDKASAMCHLSPLFGDLGDVTLTQNGQTSPFHAFLQTKKQFHT